MVENKNALLLLARAQKAQNKVEAVDTYSEWLEGNSSDAKVRYEYAQVLEAAEFFARALEEYRAVITALPQGQSTDPAAPVRTDVRVAAARLLLIADPEKNDGITELETAVTEGLTDTEKLTALLDEPGISADHKAEIRRIIENVEKAKAAAQEPPEPPEEGEEAADAAADAL
jgi:tetratricopeptide (TPR) repeat protein